MLRCDGRLTNAAGAEIAVTGLTPDLADWLIHALADDADGQTPLHAARFDDLLATIAQTTRIIAHLDQLRAQAILAADLTSPWADRKAIAAAAELPTARLYRLLAKLGQPTDRRAVPETPTLGQLQDQISDLRRAEKEPDLTADQRKRIRWQIATLEGLLPGSQ